MNERHQVFRENLIMYRQKKGLLQKQLAEQLGIATSTVSNWESGYNLPRLDTLYSICDVLGVSVGTLLGLEEFSLDKEDQILLTAYKENASMQEAVRRLLKME